MKKEHFLQSEGFKSVAASILSILIGLAVGSIVILIVGLTSPNLSLSSAWDGIRIVFGGLFSTGRDASGTLMWGFNPTNIGNMLFRAMPLIMTGLGAAVAFQSGVFNIGGEGQVLIGGLAAAACMICLGDKLPNAVVILCMIVASLAAGAIWGFIPAFFKAKWNTNETLSTLMMNYIATQLVAFYTIVWEVPKGSGKIGIINQNTNVGWLPQIFISE